MKIHDWTRVTAGTFHHFHSLWIADLSRSLNEHQLPPGFYAMAEQHAGHIVPDILALTSSDWSFETRGHEAAASEGSYIAKSLHENVVPDRAVVLADAPPKVSVRATRTEADIYRQRRRTISIRQEPDNRVVAMIEILSPGNKDGRIAMVEFIRKSTEVMEAGIHLLVVDLFPPGPSNPQGIHPLLWNGPFVLPGDRPLTLASYRIELESEAFVEPVAIGQEIPDMPIFLNPAWYVNVPLGTTYESAWRGVPAPFQRVLEST